MLTLVACLAGVLARPPPRDNSGDAARARAGHRQVVWDDVNVVSVTDVHGWVDGHRHPDNSPRLDADYGDLLSFRHHIEAEADHQRRDVLYLNSGDLVDGRGISDVTSPKGSVFFRLLQQVPFDAYTVGNHELYEGGTVRELVDSGLVGSLGGGYLSSNVVWADGPNSGTPIGSRYKVWTGKRTGIRVLLLGFLYDFVGADASVEVVPVERALEEPWVDDALHEGGIDAVVVLAHMDLRDRLVTAIVDRIRRSHPTIAVQVLAGHTHYRGFTRVDDHAASLEAGKYLDTVGWVSFPIAAAAPESTWFDYEFIDATKDALAIAAGVTRAAFPTLAGDLFREEVAIARAALGLDTVLGCPAQRYSTTASFSTEESAYGLMMRDVNPVALFLPPRNMSMVSIQSVGSLRYDVYPGAMTVDDVITVAPFGDVFFRLPAVPGSTVADTVAILSTEGESAISSSVRAGIEAIGPWVHSTYEAKSEVRYDLLVVEYDLARVVEALRRTTGETWQVEPYRHGELDSTTVWEAFVKVSWPPPCGGAVEAVEIFEATETARAVQQ